MTQDGAILSYLQAGNVITPALAAGDPFRCLALHSAIARLRKSGHRIECKIRSRGRIRWGEYRLLEQLRLVA